MISKTDSCRIGVEVSFEHLKLGKGQNKKSWAPNLYVVYSIDFHNLNVVVRFVGWKVRWLVRLLLTQMLENRSTGTTGLVSCHVKGFVANFEHR